MSSFTRRLKIALLACAALTFPVLAQELPSGSVVNSGSVGIASSGPGSMNINQSSQNAVINWNSFSIGAGGSVNIAQPNSQSALLNRVTGTATTSIAGQINANGRVFIVNPNGIAITPTGTVNAGSFVGSTLGLSDDAFNSGQYQFNGNGASAPVSNAGVIDIGSGGYAALLGGHVNNSGVINAPLGTVALGAGERVTLDLSGDGFLQVAVPSSGSGDDALITQSGAIHANGGHVQISAAAAQDAARHVINLSGLVEAKTVSGHSGSIVLGGGGGEVRVTGRLDVSAPVAGSTGGSIVVTGGSIQLAGANLNASGAAGGGSIRVGGDFRGAGLLAHAQTLTVDQATHLYADATLDGNAGTVVLWSDQLTRFAGAISAKGAGAGAGGTVEVSGKNLLAYRGLTDLSAPSGHYGNLLLDPYNITISNLPTSDTSVDTYTGTPADPAETGTRMYPSGTGSNINVNDLIAQLALANVEITTQNLNNASDPPEPGDITVNASIMWAQPTTLTLLADNDIILNADIQAAAGGLSLIAGHDVQLNPNYNTPGVPTAGETPHRTVSVGSRGLYVSAGNNLSTANLSLGQTTGTQVAVSSAGTIRIAVAGLSGNIDPATFTVNIASVGDTTFTATNPLAINAGSSIRSSAGNVVIAAPAFQNFGGANAVSAAGRFLIYVADYGTSPHGSLPGGNLYGRSYIANPPASIPGTGSYFIYVNQPTLTFTAANGFRVYYDPATGLASPTYSGLVNGDTLATAVGGTPTTTDTTPISANVGTYPGATTVTGVTSLIGYQLAFVNGNMTVTPATLAISARNLSKLYGQTVTFNGTEFNVIGLRGSDTVNTVQLASAGAPSSAPVAGSPYAITASNATGTGLGNYNISYTPGSLFVTVPVTAPSPSLVTPTGPTIASPADSLPGGLTAEVTPDSARLSLQVLEQRTQNFKDALAKCNADLDKRTDDANAFINCASDALDRYGDALDDPLIQLPPELRATVTVIRQTVQKMRVAATVGDRKVAIAQARSAVSELVNYVRQQTDLVRAVEPETEDLLVKHGEVMSGALQQLDLALVGAVEI